MTVSLISTLLLEGVVVVIYGILKKKPIWYLLVSSILLNLITQPLLWVSLSVFFRHYRIALIITELFIWSFEGLLISRLPGNQLTIKQALYLSLAMNLTSFGLGLILPFYFFSSLAYS